MRKTAILTASLILCIVLLASCAGKNDIAGVYASDSAEGNIILYQDGTAEYLGEDNATWKVHAGILTVTLHHPETYYLDVYLDNATLTEAEMRATSTKINAVDNVDSCDYAAGSNWIRVALAEKDLEGSTAAEIAQIKGITNVEEFTAPAWTTDHELTVLDGCLVKKTSGIGDIVFEKVG